MPEVPVTRQTQWECQRCGRCCIELKPSVLPDCSCFDKKTHLCTAYDKRPFSCAIYPFAQNLGAIAKDGIAEPLRAFELQHILIHSECPGFGKGKRVYANKKLQKDLGKLALRFAACFNRD